MEYSKGLEFGFSYEQYTTLKSCYREVTGFELEHPTQEWASDWLGVLERRASDQEGDRIWDTSLAGVTSRWVFPAKMVEKLTELAEFVPDLSKIPPLKLDESLERLWGYQVASSFFQLHDKEKGSWRGYVPARTLQGNHVVLELQVDPVALGVSYEVLKEHLVESKYSDTPIRILNDYARLVQVCGKWRAEGRTIKLMTEIAQFTQKPVQWVIPALSKEGEDIVLNLLVRPTENSHSSFRVIYTYLNLYEREGE